ncbi:glycoside hydrolase family 61 protein [Desarmillaria ectypa]|nr:glycoside hydrolase family 61 protein [Desarmillaria ectypa]
MSYLSSLRCNAALVVALSLLTSVRAHGYVETFVYGGTNYTGYLPYNDPYSNPVPDRIERVIPGNGPIQDVTSEDIRCNIGGTAPAALYATAEAGSSVDMHWTTWPASHAGPVITYLAQVPDGSNITSWEPGTNAVWFKVDEAGYENGKWAATDIMINEQNNVWHWTIPSGLKAGQYLVRHEIIALHAAGTYPGAQFYPGCSQIEVTGSGSDFPDSSYLVSFPGAYAGTDPGITFNIDSNISTPYSYTIPGPALWTGGSGTASRASSTAASGTSSTAASGATSTSASGPTSAVESNPGQ